jgi:hypothetical protein
MILVSVAMSALCLLIGCAAKRTPSEASQLASQGQLAEAAASFERIGRRSEGPEAADAWFRAGKLWIDPDNRKQSFRQALKCFKRIDPAAAGTQTAADARLWMFTINRLIAAEDAAAALRDITRGSERLQPTSTPAQEAAPTR